MRTRNGILAILLLTASLAACYESPTGPGKLPGNTTPPGTTTSRDTTPAQPAGPVVETPEVGTAILNATVVDPGDSTMAGGVVHISGRIEVIGRTYGISYGGMKSLIGLEFSPTCEWVNGGATCTRRYMQYDSPGDLNDPYLGHTVGQGLIPLKGDDGSEWLVDLSTYRPTGNQLWMGFLNPSAKRTKAGTVALRPRYTGWGVNLKFIPYP